MEDNEGDIILLREVLEQRPTIRKISVAKTGQEAVDFVMKAGNFAGEETPDLILLDINLPLKKRPRSLGNHQNSRGVSVHSHHHVDHLLFTRRYQSVLLPACQPLHHQAKRYECL